MSFGGGANLGSAQGVVLIDVTQALASLEALNGALAASGGAGGKAFAGAATSVNQTSSAAVGLGAALGVVFAGSIKQAADLEFRLSAIQSVTGTTDAQMAGLKDTILDVGQASIFTTNAVAETAQQLALLGVTTEQMAAGVLKSVVDLSAATETAPQVAANVIASVMNQYGIAADQTEAVADVFTRASNQSSADVTSLGEGFTYAAGTADALGISYQDLISYIEVLNDRNIKGTMAGTTLNQALESVINPTNEAADAMEKYGIVTKDAQGNFVGVPKILDQLHAALDGLGEVERSQVLDVIFGTRGGRAINALLGATTQGAKDAGKSIEDYRRALDEGATASEQAAKRMDNLRGSIERLKGALSTIAVQLGGQFLGGLKAFADGMTVLAQALGRLPEVFYQVAAAIGAPLALFGSLRFLGTLANKSIFRMIPGFEQLALVAGRLAGPLAIIVGLLEAIALIHKFNLFGLGDQMDNLVNHVKQAGKILGPAFDLIKAFWNTPFGDNQTFTTQIKDLNAFTVAGQKLGLSFNTMQTLRQGFTNLALPIRRMRNLFRDTTRSAGLMWDIFTGGGKGEQGQKKLDELKKRLERIFGPEVGRSLFQGVRRLRAGLKRFGDALGEEFGIKNPFENLSPTALLKQFPKLGKVANKLVTQFKRDVLPVVGRGLDFAFRKAGGALTFLAEHMDQIGTVIRSLLNLYFRPLLTTLDVLKNLLQGDLRGAWDALVDGVKSFGDSLLDLGGVALDIFTGIDWGGLLDGILNSLLDATGAPTWGLLWDAIVFAIRNTIPERLDLAKDVAIDFAVHVGKVAWGKASDFIGMVADFLLHGTGPSTVGDGTGGPESDNPGWAPIPIAIDLLVSIGHILWNGAVSLAEAVFDLTLRAGKASLPIVADLAVSIGGILWNGVASLAGAIETGFQFVSSDKVLHAAFSIAAEVVGVLWNGVAGLGSAIAVFVRDEGTPVLDYVANIAASIGGVLWDGVASLSAAIVNKVGIGLHQLPDAINVVANIAASIGGILWDEVASLGSAITLKVGDIAPPLIKASADIAMTLLNITYNGAQMLGTAIVEQTGEIIPPLIKASVTIGATIKDIVYSGFDTTEGAVASAMSWTGDKTIQVGTLIIQPAAVVMSEAQQDGQSWVGSLIDSLASGLSKGGAETAKLGVAIASAIASGITAIPGLTGDAATAVAGAMQSLGSSIVDLIISAITFKADLPASAELGSKLGVAVGHALASALGFLVKGPDLIDNDTVSGVAEGIFNILGTALIKAFSLGDIADNKAISGFAESLFNGIATALSVVVGGAVAAPPAILLAVGNMGRQIILAMAAGLAGFATGLAGGLFEGTAIGDAASGLGQGILDGIVAVLSDIQTLVSPEALAKAAGIVKDAVFGLIGDMISSIFGGDDTKADSFVTPGTAGTTGQGSSLANALLEGIAQALLDGLSHGSDALDKVKGLIKDKLKELVSGIIDDLPVPGFVKDRLRQALGLDDGGTDPFDEAAKKIDQGSKKLHDKFKDEDFWPTMAPPVAAPTDPVDDLLRNVGMDDGTVSSVITKAKASATKLAAGLRAAQQAGRPKLDTAEPGGRPKLDESLAGGAPKPIVVPAPDISLFTSVMASLPQIVGQTMSAALGAASAYATGIGTVVGTAIGAMVGNVSALMTGFTNAVGQGMSDALGTASVYANAIYVAVSTAIGEMIGNVAALMGALAGIIEGALAGAAASAYSQGAAIGAGLAAGINSQVGAVQAAAANLAAAAAAATAAKAQIASPSKVFMQLGSFIGEGFVVGMLSQLRAVTGAATMLADASVPSSTMTARTAAAAARSGMSTAGDTHSVHTEERNYQIAISPDMTRLSTIQDVVNVVNGLKRSIEIATAGGTVRTVT